MIADPTLPADWPRITTIDAHTAGEPLRVVVDGFPTLDGDSILEKRRNVREHHDDLRTALLWEPRGHRDMYGAIPVDPETEDGDLGVLFATNDGYSSMCGHGIIALGAVLVETGMMDATTSAETIRFDTPAGRVTATAQVAEERVTSVAFDNVPSFVSALSETVEVPGLGTIEFDLAYGGAFYAYVDADQIDPTLVPEKAREIARIGMAIKRAVADTFDIEHPDEEDLSFLYGTIFRGQTDDETADSRNVCVFADGQIDRSPTGTGVSGRLAIQHERGDLEPGESFVVESIIGTRFTGRIAETASVDGIEAVIPSVEGSASITGRNELVLDPEDPLRDGFRLD